MNPSDVRAQDARQILELNRAELRATIAASRSRPAREFPRSATFRWLARHLTPRTLASTALTSLLFRRSMFRQLLGGLLRRFA